MSVMADDVVCMVTEKLPRGMEYLLIGHSMGSVVTRLALERLMQLVIRLRGARHSASNTHWRGIS